MESNPQKSPHLFPKGFLWGASISGHQTEGGTYNQWTVWELEHANELAKTSPGKYITSTAAYTQLDQLPNWETIKKYALDPENYVSGRGIDHYNRYPEDFGLLKHLNLNALRFGIEWSRIEPKEGEWDTEAVQHYHDYIAEMNRRGIEPMLNMWHWTGPIWFEEKGGFKKASNLKYWRRFAQKVADEFGKEISYIITINEPNVFTAFSYALGEWPPQEKNYINASRVIWHLVRAHKQAYKILKLKNPQLQIGIAAQLANIQAKRPHNIFDEFSTKLMRYFWNWWFLRRIRKQQDFVGFNYYFSDYYTGLFRRENPNVPINDLGWYMEPEGLYPLILRAWVHYKKPIIITENGVADAGDQYRRWWLEETIVAMERAISEGVDLRGYFHWSLLDNFEWSYGWWPKFGLIEVDRKHGMKRTIRPSAKWFAERIEKLRE